MKTFFLSLFVCLTYSVSSQEEWFASSNPLFKNDFIKEVTPIPNTKTGEFAVFYEVRKGFIAELYNNKQELLQSLILDDIPSGNLVGYVFKEQQYTLFFSNASMKKISCVQVDFTTGTSRLIDDLELDFKGEKAIQPITNDLGFHLLTIEKKFSILKLYSFDLNGKYQERTFDLSDNVFEKDNGISYNLYSFLFVVHKVNAFEFIDSSLPCSLEQAVAPTKIYSDKKQIIVTINLTNKDTYIITLDLESSSYNFRKIENKHFIKNNNLNTYSSFLMENVLIDSYITNKKLIINFIDLENNVLLKEYSLTEKDSIYFKNSPIIQEGGSLKGYRELEKTTQFLRKVIQSKMALSAYKNNENYVVTLGSYEPTPGPWSMTGGFVGGAVGALVFSMFDSYNNSKSIRILSLLDQNFNHIPGEIPQNSFDRINRFIESKNFKNMDAQTIFKYEDHFIWGGYDSSSEVYNFFEF